ncbi:MAG: hypothetical protein ABR614_05870 [Mycobacteriales bacterium]
MSTQVSTQPYVPTPPRARPAGSRANAAALTAGPLIMLAGSLLHPAESEDGARQLAIVHGAAGRWWTAHLLLVAGAVVMIPAVLALARLLRDAAPTWARAGAIAAVTGCTMLVGVFALEGFGAYALSQVDERAAAGQAMEQVADTAMFPFALLGLGFTLGIAFLGAGLVRTRTGTPWAGLAVAVGGVVMTAGLVAEVAVLAAVGMVVLTAGLVGSAVTVRRG